MSDGAPVEINWKNEHRLRVERSIEGQSGILARLNGKLNVLEIGRHYDGFVLSAWTEQHGDYGSVCSIGFSKGELQHWYALIGELLAGGTGRDQDEGKRDINGRGLRCVSLRELWP